MRYIVLFLLWTPAAIAGPIYQYSFSVTATSGPLAGQSSSGLFSYEAPDLNTADQAFPTLGEWVFIGFRFYDFQFTWGGVDYTEDNTVWGFVTLDADGKLNLLDGNGIFGPGCKLSGSCGSTPFNIEFLPKELVALGLPSVLLRYQSGSLGEGSIAFLGEYVAVPEPATLLLLAPLLLALGRWRLAGGRGRLARPLP